MTLSEVLTAAVLSFGWWISRDGDVEVEMRLPGECGDPMMISQTHEFRRGTVLEPPVATAYLLAR